MLHDDKELRQSTLYAKLIKALMTGGGTYEELAEVTGISYPTVRRYIRALRDQTHPDNRLSKLVSITGWREADNGVARLRVLAFAGKKDVPQPKISPAEKQRKYRAKRLDRHLTLPNSVFELGGKSFKKQLDLFTQ